MTTSPGCSPERPFTSWYDLRSGGQYGATAEQQAAQQDAARKTAPLAATPATVHFDSLGRTCLSVADNGPAARYPVRVARDTEGTPLAVFDELGRRAEEHVLRLPTVNGGTGYLAGTDMAGRPVYRISADGGARRTLPCVTGQAIGAWDDRQHAFRLVYDLARRPTHRYVSTAGATEILLNLNVYGEGQAAVNLCGRLFRGYDPAGYTETSACDFTGNPVAGIRQLAADYHASADWTPLASLTTAAALDAAATAAGLVPTGDGGRDRFASTATFDALGRPVQQVTPHSPAMLPDVIQPGYDEGGQLRQVDVWPQQSAAPAALLDPASAGLHAVTAIAYNARGQRLSVGYGNGTTSAYGYDPLTFRLTALTTDPAGLVPRQPADGAGAVVLLRPGRERHRHPRRRRHAERHLLPQPAGRAVGLLHLRRGLPAARRDRPRAPRPDERRPGAARPGHRRRLAAHRPPAARRRHRDGHLHRELRLRPGREPDVGRARGELGQLDPPLRLQPSRRGSPPRKPATG